MAFNLNKNEANNPSTKFDLSKSSSPTLVNTEQEKSNSKLWLFSLLGLLVIGVTAWYFLSGSNDISKNENEVASATTDSGSGNIPAGNQNAVAVTQGDTIKEMKNTGTINTVATTGSNPVSDPGNSNTGTARTSATSFNNSVPATFTKGSTSISTMDQSLVKNLVVFLEKNSAAAINVNGYASSEGDLAINQKISQSRADAFKEYLVSKGIPRNRINSTGKGIGNPISSNDTEEGRIKNRRIEILIQ